MFSVAATLLIGQPEKRRKIETGGDTLELVEHLNVDKLQRILEHLEDLVEDQATRTKFLNFAKEIDATGRHLVAYQQKAHGKGRMTPVGMLSVQMQPSKLRDALCYGIYHDIDMSNAHPVILRWLCCRENIECPRLTQYIERRDEILASIHSNRKVAKTAFLALTYGQGLKATRKLLGGHLPTFLSEYAAELRQVATVVSERYPEFPCPNPDNALFSRLSLMLQDYENQLLQAMAEWLQGRGYTPGALAFDGLMVYRKERGSTEALDEAILRECEQHLKAKFNIELQLEEKPITKGIY